jgi:hypothetical protein
MPNRARIETADRHAAIAIGRIDHRHPRRWKLRVGMQKYQPCPARDGGARVHLMSTSKRRLHPYPIGTSRAEPGKRRRVRLGGSHDHLGAIETRGRKRALEDAGIAIQG